MVALRWECFTLPGVLEGRDVGKEVRPGSLEDESRGGEGKLKKTELCDLDFFHEAGGSHLL